VLATLEKTSFARSLTLVALDRINDVLALVIVLLIAFLSFPTQADVEFEAGTFGNQEALTVSYSLIRPIAITLSVALAILILLLVFLYFRQDMVLRLMKKVFEPASPKVSTWLSDTFLNFASGMHIFKSGGQMTLSVLWSLCTWGLIAISLVMLLKAFHLELPWYGAFTILAVLGVFTSVTVTPGMIGQYHVPMAASLFLVFPGINANEAKAIAIVAHLVALVPPVVLGIYSMMGEQLKFRDLIPDRGSKTAE
jgi:uncharacterized membrane protein YbhN (UPF0104 family)